ncbi:MAG: hypothetical protein JST12_14370 [Armatimonadetes bacterium]|nr:hypothetical protein [Armatimonadota bacterium]
MDQRLKWLSVDAPFFFSLDRRARGEELRAIDLEYQVHKLNLNTTETNRLCLGLLRAETEYAESQIGLSEEISERIENLQQGIDSLTEAVEFNTTALHIYFPKLIETAEIHNKLVSDLMGLVSDLIYVAKNPKETLVLEQIRNLGAALNRLEESTEFTYQDNLRDVRRKLAAILADDFGRDYGQVWFIQGIIERYELFDDTASYRSFKEARRLIEPSGSRASIAAYRYYADTLYRLGQADRAYRELNQFAEIVSLSDPAILYELARYAAASGRQVEAEDILERVILLNPIYGDLAWTENDFINGRLDLVGLIGYWTSDLCRRIVLLQEVISDTYFVFEEAIDPSKFQRLDIETGIPKHSFMRLLYYYHWAFKTTKEWLLALQLEFEKNNWAECPPSEDLSIDYSQLAESTDESAATSLVDIAKRPSRLHVVGLVLFALLLLILYYFVRVLTLPLVWLFVVWMQWFTRKDNEAIQANTNHRIQFQNQIKALKKKKLDDFMKAETERMEAEFAKVVDNWAAKVANDISKAQSITDFVKLLKKPPFILKRWRMVRRSLPDRSS